MALSGIAKQQVKGRDGKRKAAISSLNLFLLTFAAAMPAIVSSGIAHKIGATQEWEAA